MVSEQTDSRGYAVVQVSYSESPEVSRRGLARLDRLVVHPRDPRFAGTGPAARVAQYEDPFSDDDNNLDDELNRDIARPFNGGSEDPSATFGPMPPVEPLPNFAEEESPELDGTEDPGQPY